MNLGEIEENVKRVVSDPDADSFIFRLLAAYGKPKVSITRLQKGNSNLSKRADELIWKKNLLFRRIDSGPLPSEGEDIHVIADRLMRSEEVTKHDLRFVIVTDFETLLAVDTKFGETLDIKFSQLPKHAHFFLPWITDDLLPQAKEVRSIRERIEKVYQFRVSSKARTTNAYSSIPHKFAQSKKVVRASFSGKSRKKTSKLVGPPAKVTNLEKRSREYLSVSEVNKLIKTAKSLGRHGERDALIILITYRHALRVGELVDLWWDQMDLNRGRMHVNRLKNGDPSVHYLEGDEIRALRKVRRDYSATDFVFESERQGPLTSSAIHKMVARAGIEAELELSVHPHMLRHGKGHQLASEGVDTRAIQAYMGHKNIQHTVLYTQLNPRRFKGFGKDVRL